MAKIWHVVFALFFSPVFVLRDVGAILCYVCKYNPAGVRGLITPCPDINDETTTKTESCLNGICLTLTGTQEWRGQTVQGVVRHCLNPKVIDAIFDSNWMRTSELPSCLTVSKSSYHNHSQQGAELCDESKPKQSALTIVGQACLCATELCNGGSPSNNGDAILAPSFYWPVLLLFPLLLLDSYMLLPR